MYPLGRENVLLSSGQVEKLSEMRRAIQLNLDELPFFFLFFLFCFKKKREDKRPVWWEAKWSIWRQQGNHYPYDHMLLRYLNGVDI